MTDLTALPSFLIPLSNYPIPISFLSPILAGEGGVIAVAFLAASGLFSIYKVILFAFLGMLTVDSIWFAIAKSKFFKKLGKWKKVQAGHKRIEKRLEFVTGGNDVLILLIAKILVGTRILIILYLSMKKISYKKFLLYATLPNLIWVITLTYIGWLAQAGYTWIIVYLRDIQLAVTFLIVFFLALYYLVKWINNLIVKKPIQ